MPASNLAAKLGFQNGPTHKEFSRSVERAVAGGSFNAQAG